MLVVGACGGAGPPQATELTVADAWARPTPEGADNGVVYLTITSPEQDRLVGASVDPRLAARTELHESMLHDGGSGSGHHGGGSASSSGSTPGVEIKLPAGTPVSLEPGGLHVMLESLEQPLEEGDRFTVQLELDRAGAVPVEVEVRTNRP